MFLPPGYVVSLTSTFLEHAVLIESAAFFIKLHDLGMHVRIPVKRAFLSSKKKQSLTIAKVSSLKVLKTPIRTRIYLRLFVDLLHSYY